LWPWSRAVQPTLAQHRDDLGQALIEVDHNRLRLALAREGEQKFVS
jgi:hypothetical protein